MKETKADVTVYNATPANTSFISNDLGEEADFRLQRVPLNQCNLYYDMTGEKHLHIFNHFSYENNSVYGQNAQKYQRDGTHEDVRSLEDTFSGLGFSTTVHPDLRHEDILKEMTKLCTMDHSSTSCIAVAVMTHGRNGGVLLASDRPYHLRELTDILNNGHPSLADKPKLLFVQACRSGHLDNSRPVLRDAGNDIILASNTMLLCASSPHYYAYRGSSGTWLMQSLCEVLNQHYQFFDLLQMITLVNQAVAYKSTYSKNPKNSMKKQMPETKHTLTKLLKF